MACTPSGMLPYAVIRITSTAGAASLILLTSSTPLPSGNLTSQSTTSGSCCRSIFIPEAQSAASATSYPSSPIIRESSLRSCISSSMISTFAIRYFILPLFQSAAAWKHAGRFPSAFTNPGTKRQALCIRDTKIGQKIMSVSMR